VTDSVLETSIALAVEAHKGQVDKAGRPYILHPLRLMSRMTTDDERIVAVLHDVVEDTDVTFDELRELGMPEKAISALELLTHRQSDGTDEDYFSYIKGIIQNPIARAVKLADLGDNLDVCRLSKITERDARRLDKYLQARRILLDTAN
jgi:(p)ppGpp synthase/HD superfamily hydrolase